MVKELDSGKFSLKLVNRPVLQDSNQPLNVFRTLGFIPQVLIGETDPCSQKPGYTRAGEIAKRVIYFLTRGTLKILEGYPS